MVHPRVAAGLIFPAAQPSLWLQPDPRRHRWQSLAAVLRARRLSPEELVAVRDLDALIVPFARPTRRFSLRACSILRATPGREQRRMSGPMQGRRGQGAGVRG